MSGCCVVLWCIPFSIKASLCFAALLCLNWIITNSYRLETGLITTCFHLQRNIDADKSKNNTTPSNTCFRNSSCKKSLTRNLYMQRTHYLIKTRWLGTDINSRIQFTKRYKIYYYKQNTVVHIYWLLKTITQRFDGQHHPQNWQE